jgi:peptide-methionine (R)-S-oxide reductase
MDRRTALKLSLAATTVLAVGLPGIPWADTGNVGKDSLRVWSVARGGYIMVEKVRKSADEWRRQLTAEQYRVTREKGTERAFTGKDWDNHADGIYRCVCCGQDLFDARAKFESGTGWPSYTEPVAAEAIATAEDRGFFMVRTEVLCSRCDSHLGHVFPDVPKPTGLRYCMNSAALVFVPRDQL